MPTNDAVVFRSEREVAVEERPVPEPGDGQIQIETARTLVSTGTELAILTGKLWPDELPLVPGYCNVGTVVATGPGVGDDLLGARVATRGDHRRYTVADVDACRRIPEGVTDEEAAFTTIAEIAMNGVRRGRVDWGETVALFGLGLVGQFAARFCRLAGAHPVVGFDLAASRIDGLPDRPGVRGVDPRSEDPPAAVEERAGDLADAVFEVTGRADQIADQFDALREQGRLVVLGSPRGSGEFSYLEHCHRPSYEVIGAHANSHPDAATARYPWTAHRHGELFLDLADANRVGVESLVTHRYAVDRAPDAYGMLLDDRTGALGVLFEW